ncbi:beta-N-acetylhexosaminidase [Rhodanobacter koreensis]
MPASIELGDGALRFSGRLQVRWDGEANAFVNQAVERTNADLQRLAGKVDSGPDVTLTIRCCRRMVMDTTHLDIGEENYRLLVDGHAVTLIADTPIGALRGLATLRQLAEPGQGEPSLRRVDIRDEPRFAWRGLMIDVARHFASMESLKRQIDAMERLKLNVLHLHFSDDEAFRIQSSAFPELTRGLGGEFYTQAQIRDLVSYAFQRGVRVVPELDVPGHAGAILRAYPQYASGQSPAGGGTLNPALPATYAFLEKLFGELGSLFSDPDFHIGGDEVKGLDWAANQDIQNFMAAQGLHSKQELQEYFFLKVRDILRRQGKHVIGWEEVATGATPRDVIVQAWQSSNAIDNATRHGNRVIVSAGYYLDYLLPASAYYKVDPLDPSAAGIDPAIFAKVQASYPKLIPYFPRDQVKDPSLKLTPAQQKLVIGGEAALWSELVTDEMIDGRLWPRSAAIAERFWSPRNTTDANDMYRRLAVIQDELRILGLDDQANMDRMLARLAPGESDALAVFANVVTPVRNFAHMHKLVAYAHHQPLTPQYFNQIADAALPDNPVATCFNRDADAYAHGDHGRQEALKAQLIQWRDNHARFLVLAERHPDLKPAVATSADLSALARCGLEALDIIASGGDVDPQWKVQARTLLDRQQKYVQASDSFFATIVSPSQPPADLLIAIEPGIGTLVDAAIEQTSRKAPH